MITRAAVMSALFDLTSPAAGFVTTGRVLLHWSQVSAQPALFVIDAEEEWSDRPSGMPAKAIIGAELWVYTKGTEQPDLILPDALNELLDALETALAPSPITGRQTLGGLVEHCWIQGQLIKTPGHIEGQAAAMIPIRMLSPR